MSRLKNELEAADAVVIGAGAGLSTSAGFVYTGERFQQYFSDFAEKYNFPGYVHRRFLSLCDPGGALGLLEPVHLHQPLSGRAKADL